MATTSNAQHDAAHLYDGVASEYEHAWKSPAALPLLGLFDSLLRHYAPDHLHTRVLELACGTGYLLQRIRRAIRPDYIVGVDISADMIREAQRIEEATNRRGQAPIDFLVADCTQPIPQLEDQRDKFDIVMANFLFNYAKTEEEMQQMWRNISLYLRPGGLLIACTQSFDVLPKSVQTKKYGMLVTNLEEGSTDVCVRQQLDFGWHDKYNVGFESFMIRDRNIWERTAMKAGLQSLKFHRFGKEDIPLKADTTEGEKSRDDDYWDLLIREPFNLLMTADKTPVAH